MNSKTPSEIAGINFVFGKNEYMKLLSKSLNY